jgi:hypothetical protein
MNVPDVWIAYVREKSETYVYTDDQAIVDILNTGVTL